MSFFDSIPQPPPEPRQRLRRPAWERPGTVIPGSVPAELILARTDEVAVAVGSVRAYPNGFEFTVHVRARRADDAVGDFDPFERLGYGRERRAPHDALRLGVLYADGRRTATTAGHPLKRDDNAENLILRHGGGGGDDRSWDSDFWVYPLPPAGPVTLVASWLEHGIAETRAELDGAAIREAAGHAVALWPDEPDRDCTGSSRTGTIGPFVHDEPGPGPEPGDDAADQP
jgi:hypothetical protein